MPKYVGRTSRSLKQRLNNHWSHRFNDTVLGGWLRELESVGMRPEITSLEETCEDYELYETKWINHYISCGIGLFNKKQTDYGYYKPHPNSVMGGSLKEYVRLAVSHPYAYVTIGYQSRSCSRAKYLAWVEKHHGIRIALASKISPRPQVNR
jgi:hypothetical protein